MRRVWVIHRGALGDSLLLWPLLRALTLNARVTFAASPSHAALAARFIGVAPMSCDSRTLTLLHASGASPPPSPIEGVSLVVSLAAGPDHAALWLHNARLLFPGAAFEIVASQLDRELAKTLALAHAPALPLAAPRTPPDKSGGCPVLVHVGAGSREKRWPLDRFVALVRLLPDAALIGGEAERERFTPDERRDFLDAGGRFIGSLDALADTILAARFFIGCDSGPSHLAASVGTPSLTLFGPTDPAYWAPLGEKARVLSTPSREPMDRITVDDVLAALAQPLELNSRARCPGSPPHETSGEASW